MLFVIPSVMLASPAHTQEGTHAWTQRAPMISPTPRAGHVMGWDPERQQIVLFGGRACPNPQTCALSAETWIWDGAEWTLDDGAGPEPLMNAGLTAHSETGALILHGGHTGEPQPAFEIWQRTGGAWVEREINGNVQREGHGLVHLPPRGANPARMVLFSGREQLGPNTRMTDSTMRLDDGDDETGWRNLSIGQRPSPRRDATLIFFPNNERAVLFGGRPCLLTETCDPEADTWVLSEGWGAITPTTTPPARFAAAAVRDTARETILLFGGRGTGGPLADLHAWNGTDWTSLDVGAAPPGRAYAAIAYDPVRDTYVLFGGTAGNDNINNEINMLGDTWELAPRDLSCQNDDNCDTGFCTDGVCCDVGACGTCETCAGDRPGTCQPVRDAPDPDSCEGACDPDGQCIEGACETDEQCGPCGVCEAGTCAPTPVGTEAPECAPFACGGNDTQCPEECDDNEECAGERVCNDDDQCVNQGAACAEDGDCDTGFCTDGVCCDSRCDEPCAQCAEDGACEPAPEGDPGDPVCERACDGDALECPTLSNVGTRCQDSLSCASGLCIEGVCCSPELDCGMCSPDGNVAFEDGTTRTCFSGCDQGRCIDDPQNRGTATPRSFDLGTPGVGCGCQTPTRPASGGAALGLLALAFLLWRRRSAQALLLALAALTATSCAARVDIDSDEACRNAGFAIASRTQSCTGDDALANTRYEDFVDAYRCTVPDAPLPQDFACGAEVGDLDCDTVEALGDNLDAWLQRPSCDAILTRADGSTLLTPSGYDEPRCNGAIQRAAVRYGACFEPQTPLTELETRMLEAALARFDCGPSDGFEACEAALLDLDCAAITQDDLATTIEQTGDACAVFTPRTPE